MNSNQNYQPIPFFVVDRPMSLKILDYCNINNQPFTLGLMGHANTSLEFQDLFRSFNNKNIIKIVDSGVFTKNGCMNGYSDLFSTYMNMGIDYGIMIDILKDKEKTIESAKKAMIAFKIKDYPFKLIGVAQGNEVGEYLECYQCLKELGFDYIAIGGLLRKTENSARYVKVRDEQFLIDVVSKIREYYPKDWLFLLGSYHPKRHKIFENFKIFGGDYKGWIFQYTPPEDWIKKDHMYLSKIELTTKKKVIDHELMQIRSSIIHELHSKDISLIEKNERRNQIKDIDDNINKIRERNAYLFGEDYISRINFIRTIYNLSEEQLREYRFAQIRNYIESQVYSNFRKRLLIIGCSNKKNRLKGLVSAFDLYNGPNYLSLKKLKSSKNFPPEVQIVIISAKYGVIYPDQLVEYYDQKMTPDQVNILKSGIKKKLEKYLNEKGFEECLINLGKLYRQSIVDVQFPHSIKKIEAKGKIGEKRSIMLKWLKKII
jgi:hypothetical protein